MKKAIGLALATVAALTVSIALAVPSQASSLHHAEKVIRASNMSSIWHRHGQGYVIQNRDQTRTQVVTPRREAMTKCSDNGCRAIVRHYYRSLRHQWRLLNKNLWRVVAALPRCSRRVTTGCVRLASSVPLFVYGRHFTANQRARFAS